MYHTALPLLALTIPPLSQPLPTPHLFHLPPPLTHFISSYTSARPEVRGTADVGWRSLFPLPLNPPRTHSRLYHHMCLRTDGQ